MNSALQDKLKLAATVLAITFVIIYGVVWLASSGTRRASTSSGSNDVYLGAFTSGQNALSPAISRVVTLAEAKPGQKITVRWQYNSTYPQIVFDPGASQLTYQLDFPKSSRWQFSGVSLDMLRRAQTDGNVKSLESYGASGGFIK